MLKISRHVENLIQGMLKTFKKCQGVLKTILKMSTHVKNVLKNSSHFIMVTYEKTLYYFSFGFLVHIYTIFSFDTYTYNLR